MEYIEFPKIARLTRPCTITEKIDGTNALVYISGWLNGPGDSERGPNGELCIWSDKSQQCYMLQAGSRTRWITPEQDNMGFARWAYANAHELVDGLGEGLHYGEWWGLGIQRGYGLKEKRFSLFNSAKWTDDVRPKCCHVVPVLYQGVFDTGEIESQLLVLAGTGSKAAPGYMNPEGIVIWHEAARVMFKKTIEKDEQPKGRNA